MTRKIHTLLTLSALLAGAFLFAAPVTHAFKHLESGQTPEDFTLESIDGSSRSLAASRGKSATVVVFWAAWSPRSAELLADVQLLFAEHAASGLGVLGVNVEHPEWDPAEFDKIRMEAKTAGVTYPMLLDKDYSLFNRFGLVAIPSTMVLDGEGRITMLISSYSTGAHRDLKDEVLRLLGKLEAPALASNVSTPKFKGKAIRFLNEGKILMDRKRFSRAIEPLRKALAEDPECAEAYRLLAQIYDKMGQAPEATAAAEKARELDNAASKTSDATAAATAPATPAETPASTSAVPAAGAPEKHETQAAPATPAVPADEKPSKGDHTSADTSIRVEKLAAAPR